MNNRILVSSIPSWNQKTGSNTFSSILCSFDSEELANIYIQGDLPDSPVCGRYFHIDEKSVIKSVIFPGIKTGEEVKPNTDLQQIGNNNPYRIFKRFRLLLWARELGWRLGHWNSKALNVFIQEFSPEVFIFPIEDYPYFNRINQYIIKEYRPKQVIGYFWDDNFSYKQHPYNILFKVERFFRRRSIKKLVSQCTDLLAISPKMKKECDKEFSTDSIVITKPMLNEGNFCRYDVHYPIKILYTGKLIIGRYDTILKVVSVIKMINSNGAKVHLDIYTQTDLPKRKRNKLSIPGCSEVHNSVPQSKVKDLQERADILLFAESLSSRDLSARLSFSTKLTDYFAAGKCIWAVGNADLGPIDYIKSENAGFVSTNEREIKSVLNEIVTEPYLVSEKAALAFECGKRNHSKGKIINKLNELINSSRQR